MRKVVLVILAVMSVSLLGSSNSAVADDESQWSIWRAACLEAGNGPIKLADEPLTIKVWQNPNNDQYKEWVPVINGRIIGHTRSGDAIKIVISKDGKDLITLRKGLKGNNPEELGYCENFTFDVNDEGTALSATGELTLTFKYYNDQDETESVIGIRKIKVVKLAQHIGSFKHVWKYGILSDDLAGSSYFYLSVEDEWSIPRVWFYTWGNRENGNIEDVSCKIEVDGKRIELPNNFLSTYGDISSLEQREELYLKDVEGNGVINDYNWYKIRWCPNLYWGEKRDDVAEHFIAMIDHPGNWVVKIRSNGKIIRELRFTVTPDGLIAAHPEQDASKPGAICYGPGRYFVETYFGNPNEFDARFNSTAISEGMMYGRQWTSDEVKNGMIKALPSAIRGKRVFPTAALPR